ncbi:MAG: alpha/beta hydrolase family protein [Polyangiales bacterium]
MPGESRAGKLWRSHGLPYDGGKVPLVVFVHGITFDGLRHHWLTEDPNGPWDARPFMESLVDEGRIAPLVVAVPSQTKDASDPAHLFEDIDFDAFVDVVDGALAPWQRVDRERVVIIGHSGAVCDPSNATFAALHTKKLTARALIAVDGCLAESNATLLASTTHVRDVIVTYQDQIWKERPFDEFRNAWDAALEKTWPRGLRVLERHELQSENAHLELVEVTARRWLPVILPPVDGVSWTALLQAAPPPTVSLMMPALSSLL